MAAVALNPGIEGFADRDRAHFSALDKADRRTIAIEQKREEITQDDQRIDDILGDARWSIADWEERFLKAQGDLFRSKSGSIERLEAAHKLCDLVDEAIDTAAAAEHDEAEAA